MKTTHKLFLFFLLLLTMNPIIAQEDLLSLIEDDTEEEIFTSPSFKAIKIGNLQSTKVAAGGDLYMYVSHRFGSLKDGTTTFFGLDNANTKIQLIYGLFDGLHVGLSRESFRKTYAGSVKMKLINQTSKFPLTLTAYSTINLNSQLSKEQYTNMKYADRLSYCIQLLIAKRFSNSFSFEVAPTFVRQNLVFEKEQSHEQYALGMGFRYKLSKRISFNVDYIFNASRWEDSVYNDPLTIGIDIETGGHVFQLLFANSQSTNEPSFVSNASGDWSSGVIFFGFNIVRVF